MNIARSQEVRAKIAGLSTGSQNEECGVLVGMRSGSGYVIVDVLRVPNVAEDPRNRFGMAVGEIRLALKAHGYDESQIIGAAHTHPKGSKSDPSILDLEALPYDYLGCVFHVTTQTLTFYDSKQGFIMKEKFVADRV